MAAAVRSEPEVTDYQVYAGIASPFNFNGLVRHYFMRRGANVADIQVNLVPKHERKAQSHDIAKRVRPRVAAIAAQYGARVAVAEVPPGPPVLQTLVAEVYGPDRGKPARARARRCATFSRRHAGRGGRRLVCRGRPAEGALRDRQGEGRAARHQRRDDFADAAHRRRRRVGRSAASAAREGGREHRAASCRAAARTTPEELLALRVRSGDANALPEPGARRWPRRWFRCANW